MTKLMPNEWLALCRQYADYVYGYSDLVNDHSMRFEHLCREGTTVMDAVSQVGHRYGLVRMDDVTLRRNPLTYAQMAARYYGE